MVAENFFNIYYLKGPRPLFFHPPVGHVYLVLVAAFLLAAIHWYFSTTNLIVKLCSLIGADPIDPKDTYHQYFRNIVDEVSVATGGRSITPMVIRSSYMNAFALEDFNGQAIIGVTEGLLARLNRAQIEAVVGHEAGHIASGDCLNTTVLCSLAEIYEAGLSRAGSGFQNTKGKNIALLISVFLVLAIMELLSRILRCFLSRERELRADAVSVRLTRDPLSLAEALMLITRNWRGEGATGDSIQSIFIVNPRLDELDEQEGIFPDLFSTHPPARKRIDILLSMAHLDAKTLEDNLKNFRRVSPVAKPEFKPDIPAPAAKRWLILDDNKNWGGPFSLEELRKTPGLYPTQWIRPEGEDQAKMMYQEPELKALFDRQVQGQGACPYCKVGLEEVHYEGAIILKCAYCAGAFAESDKISRILIRQDYLPSQEVVRLGNSIISSNKRSYFKTPEDKNLIWVIDCPKCKNKMRRQFYLYSYPIEIDRCLGCSGIWFDKFELEILQYIYENKKDFYQGSDIKNT